MVVWQMSWVIFKYNELFIKLLINFRKISEIYMLSHTDTDKLVLSCLVRDVNRIGDKSRLFSVVLTAFQDWTKLSPTVLTCPRPDSVHTADTDKKRQSCLVLSVSAVWYELVLLSRPHFQCNISRLLAVIRFAIISQRTFCLFSVEYYFENQIK